MFEISKLEFQKWLDIIAVEKMNPYEKTIVGIIIENFDEIAACGTANGTRAKLLGNLIRSLNNKTKETPISLKETYTKQNKVKRLLSLSIENFRGFGVKEDFNFKTQYTFYHGPNGSGKTSFCEAIEYSVLGTIAEAASRNIPLNKYITHCGKKNATNPILKCELVDGHEDVFPTSLSTYRFAFIERNRIIDFSHMGAATAKVQADRISALFGLTEFQTFVHEFTDSFDKRYIALESDELQQLKEKKQTYNEDCKKKKPLKERMGVLSQELQQLVDNLGKNDIKTVDEAITYLDPVDGKIAEASKQAAENHLDPININIIEEIKKETDRFLSATSDIQRANREILSDVTSTNLLELYNAVLTLKKTYVENVCPVCRTPFEKAVENPFEFAENELNKYKRISNAKENIEIHSKEAAQSIQKIKLSLTQKEIKNLLTRLKTDEISVASEQESDYRVIDIQQSKLFEQVNQVHSFFENEELTSEIEKHNLQIKENNAKYNEALKALQKIYKRILSKQTEYDECKKQEDEISNTLRQEKEEIQKAEKKAVSISKNIEFNKKMVDAYESIRRKLVNYMTTLPSRLAKDLSKKACEYYNYINKDDADFELMEFLELPVATSDKIMVKMRDETYQDALQILSEGHMRILGLSILLAKAVSESMPFLVFDDIVNSIDDDHRDGVAALLITHQDFQNTQMILTCHGELFVTLLEGYVNNKSKMARYMFLPADTLQERGVVIKYQDSTLPIKVAREKFQNGELKDAAAKCRQAVECISGSLWSKITSSGGTISVPLRSIDGRPDLYSIVDGLRIATKPKKLLNAENVNGLLTELQNKRIWNQLNKGTHVDQSISEFSRGEVKELLELVEKLNECVKKTKISLTINKNLNL